MYARNAIERMRGVHRDDLATIAGNLGFRVERLRYEGGVHELNLDLRSQPVIFFDSDNFPVGQLYRDRNTQELVFNAGRGVPSQVGIEFFCV